MLDLNFTPFPALSTKRLMLRALAPADIHALFALRSDPRVMKHIGRPLAKTLEDAAKFMQDMQETFAAKTGIVWAITRHGDPELIGTIGFWRIEAEHHHGELGYILKPELWGQGFTREAASAVIAHGFDGLSFHRIEACVDPANSASIGLLESLGFVREARFTQNFFFEGAFLDTLVYAMLRPMKKARSSDWGA